MYFKFSDRDIFRNTIVTHPKFKCLYQNLDGVLYFAVNNPSYTGSNRNIPSDGVSVLEKNVDRESGQQIYPFVPKTDAANWISGYSEDNFQNTTYGTDLTGSYLINKTIARDYVTSSAHPFVNSIKNTWNRYRIYNSEFSESNFPYPFSYHILPREIYGSALKKGSVVAGINIRNDASVGEFGYAIAQDINSDGVLRLTHDSLITSSLIGQVVGYVFYEEGVILFKSASIKLQNGYQEPIIPLCTSLDIEWYSGSGVQDRNWVLFGDTSFCEESPCFLNFQGTHRVNNITMMCKAPSAKLNTSNNPTFLNNNQNLFLTQSSKYTFIENTNLNIHNNLSSSLNLQEEEFSKETYIHEIYVYDEHKKIIGIAKLANPVKKKENNEFVFKISVDF